MTHPPTIKTMNIKQGLPQNPDQALRELIQISEMLLNVSEREAQMIAQQNLMDFAIIQDEKSLIAERYSVASEAFRERLEDFRGADRALVGRLDRLQRQIREVSEENKILVTQMRNNAQKTTQKTLLTVQELAQDRPVSFTPLQDNTEEGRL